jgi:hypothetical protein
MLRTGVSVQFSQFFTFFDSLLCGIACTTYIILDVEMLLSPQPCVTEAVECGLLAKD